MNNDKEPIELHPIMFGERLKIGELMLPADMDKDAIALIRKKVDAIFDRLAANAEPLPEGPKGARQ